MRRQLLFLLVVMFIAGCKKDEVIPVVSVTGVTVSPTAKTITEGEDFTISATVLPDDAENKSISWSSSDAKVAEVNNSGKVIGIKPGTAIITVKTADGDKTATTNVTIEKKIINVESIEVSPVDVQLIVGESVELTATVLPDDADDKSITWSSGDKSIAEVDANGKVTAMKHGTTKITVTTTDGGKKTEATINVISNLTNQKGVYKGFDLMFKPAFSAKNKDGMWHSVSMSDPYKSRIFIPLIEESDAVVDKEISINIISINVDGFPNSEAAGDKYVVKVEIISGNILQLKSKDTDFRFVTEKK